MIQLIGQTLCLQHEQALHWAREFVSKPLTTVPNQPYTSHSLELKNTEAWLSQKPSQNSPAPPLGAISKKLTKQYDEVARHPYKDESGQLLF